MDDGTNGDTNELETESWDSLFPEPLCNVPSGQHAQFAFYAS